MKLSARVWLAIGATAAINALLILPLSLAAITFLRDRMHLYCDFARMGPSEAGSYLCADGIGYLVPGLGIGLVVGSLFLAGALVVAIWVPRPSIAVRAAAGVALAAVLFTVVVPVWIAATRHSGSAIPVETWADVMGRPTVLFVAAAGALVLAMVLRSPGTVRVALTVALITVLAATIVEPTLAFGTAPALAAVGAALVLSWRHRSGGRTVTPTASDRLRSASGG